jgi:hypothetical protein
VTCRADQESRATARRERPRRASHWCPNPTASRGAGGLAAADFSARPGSTLEVRFARDGLRLGFLTTITMFSAPAEVTLQELRIESWFPLDDATAVACRRSASGGQPGAVSADGPGGTG